MENQLTNDQLKNLENCINYVKANPLAIHEPNLDFLKKFIESYGGKVQAAQQNENSNASYENVKKEPEVKSESESEESDIDFDLTGVIDPDTDAPQKMGDPNKVPTEEEIAEAQTKRSEAVSAFIEKNYAKAVELYTEAIILNPQAALLFAKRGQAYLMLEKPNACIRDCDRALELNPDSAAAHKFRGRAYQLLGLWEEAATDLRLACKYDFDEQANEWLKLVTPNAQKIEEHKRKKERKQLEKEDKERAERLKRAREASARAREASAKTAAPNDGATGGFPGTQGFDFSQFLNDPELIQAFKDPEIIAAFNDISMNPTNLFKYQGNPKIMAMIGKMSAKFGGPAAAAKAGARMPGGMPGAEDRATPNEPPNPFGPCDDVGLD